MNLCSSCHRPLPDDAPVGLCPHCVLTAANAALPSAALPPIEEIRAAFPQFEILECIGHGGMGVVYKVRHPQLDRLLALKVLLPSLTSDPGFAIRFEREARVLAKLAHPNLVAVHDYGETPDGLCWLTMEYVEGVNLRQAMQAARFTPEQALAVIPDLCAALQYAHDQGVLHRDIKPENILLDAAGRVKVVDFGIARLTGEDPHRTVLTMTGASLGTTAYAAPEQIEKPHLVDHRADLYSLGVVLYEMLTGELPLGRFPAPSERSGSDPRLDQVVFRTLEKEREKRYQTATEMDQGVRDASTAAPAPVLSAAPAPQKAWPPWGQRPRAGFVALAMLLGGIALIPVAALLHYLGAEAPGSVFRAATFAFSLAALGLAGSGLVASWSQLWRSRHSGGDGPVHPLLAGLTVWLPVLLVAGAAAFSRTMAPHRPFQGKGDCFINMLEVAGIVLAIAMPLFWLVRGLDPARRNGKAFRRTAIFTTVLAAGVLAEAKRQDGHWPLANFYGEMSLNMIGHGSIWDRDCDRWQKALDQARLEGREVAWRASNPPPELPAEVAAREASAAWGNRLVIHHEGQPPYHGSRLGFQAENSREWAVQARAIIARLESTLPSGIAYSIAGMRPEYDDNDLSVWEFLGRNPQIRQPVRMPVMVMAGTALCAVLVAWLLVCGRSRIPVAVLITGCCLMLVTPVWNTAGHNDSLVVRSTPPPLPPRTFTIDFSGPALAAQTVFDAAWAGDAATVRRGLSRAYLKTVDEGGFMPAVMRALSIRTGVTFSPHNPARATEPVPWPQATDTETAHTVGFRRGKNQSGDLPMILEDGEWKIATLKPLLPAEQP